ncbi:MAG: 50S ribosomal protein L18Ae [Infirmifilum sp.]
MASVRTFEITGEMKLRLGMRQKFRVYVRGLAERDALESLYSILGSRHKITRNHIKVHAIREVKPEDIDDTYIRSLAQTDKIVVYR